MKPLFSTKGAEYNFVSVSDLVLVLTSVWCPQDGVDEITDEETLSLLQLAVHTPEVARNVMYPVFFAVGALLLAAVAIFIYHRFVLSVLFALGSLK